MNIDLFMKSNHFRQEKVHESPFSDTRSLTMSTIYSAATWQRGRMQDKVHSMEEAVQRLSQCSTKKTAQKVSTFYLYICT